LWHSNRSNDLILLNAKSKLKLLMQEKFRLAALHGNQELTRLLHYPLTICGLKEFHCSNSIFIQKPSRFTLGQ